MLSIDVVKTTSISKFIMFPLILTFSIFTLSYAQLVCEPGTYFSLFGDTRSTCVPCEAGTFLPIRGAKGFQSCIKCPLNTVTRNRGSIECTPCPDGQVSNFGNFECVSCPPGTFLRSYSSFEQEDECKPCVNGYTSEPNQRQCTFCPAGFAAPPGSTSPNDCSRCPPRTGPNSATGECTKCFGVQDGVTTDECETCPLGSTQDVDPNTACLSCLPGDHGVIQRGRRTMKNVCVRCPKGTTTFAFGNTICVTSGQPCPDGSFQTSLGDCLSCPPDFFIDKTTTPEKCSRCLAGQGSEGGIVETCETCVNILRTSVTISRCYLRVQNFRQRQNDFVPLNDDNNCPPGTKTNGRYPYACENCGLNRFSTEFNSTECEVCPINTWTNKQFGQTRCTPCPEGFFSFGQDCVALNTGCTPNTKQVVETGFCKDLEPGETLDPVITPNASDIPGNLVEEMNELEFTSDPIVSPSETSEGEEITIATD